MTTHYKNELANLQQQYRAEMAALQKEVDDDPGLNAQGKHSYMEQRAAPVRAKYSRLVETLEAQMKNGVQAAKATAVKTVSAGAAKGDTRNEWERVTMLLASGANLTELVGKADQARLTAIQEWGPAYLEAQSLKSRPSGLDGVRSDGPNVQGFMAKVTQRWAAILPDGHQIVAGAEAAAVEAGFEVTANGFKSQLDGNSTGGAVGLGAAVELHYIEDSAVADFTAIPSSGE